MKSAYRYICLQLLIACLLATFANLALAGAKPDPKPEHFIGPFPWGLDPVHCAAFGPDPIWVETFVEELWGHILGEFNQGFSDANGGWHQVQPAHWVMSATSLSGDYSWWGRASGRAVLASPAEGYGGNFSFLTNSILSADGDWPDLRLQLIVRVVVDANGELKVSEDMLEITCLD